MSETHCKRCLNGPVSGKFCGWCGEMLNQEGRIRRLLWVRSNDHRLMHVLAVSCEPETPGAWWAREVGRVHIGVDAFETFDEAATLTLRLIDSEIEDLNSARDVIQRIVEASR